MKLRLLTELDENDVVQLTPEWLKTEYDRLNELYFDGELKACQFGLFTAGRGAQGGVLGWFKITGTGLYVDNRSRRIYQKDPWGGKNYVTDQSFVMLCKPRIELNGNYRWTKKAALSTLIHEMCHYYCNMNGYRPTQHHGPEFKAIARRVSAKSNEFFSVQRIAQAEFMEGVELNDEMAEKKKRKEAAKKSKTIVALIKMRNGQIRLFRTANIEVLDDVVRYERGRGACSEILKSQDPGLIDLITSKGYGANSRTYRFWDITGTPILRQIEQFNFEKYWSSAVSNINEASVLNSDVAQRMGSILSFFKELPEYSVLDRTTKRINKGKNEYILKKMITWVNYYTPMNDASAGYYSPDKFKIENIARRFGAMPDDIYFDIFLGDIELEASLLYDSSLNEYFSSSDTTFSNPERYKETLPKFLRTVHRGNTDNITEDDIICLARAIIRVRCNDGMI